MRVLVYHQNIGYPNSAEPANREPTVMHTVQIFCKINSKKHAGRPRTNEVNVEYPSKAKVNLLEHYQGINSVLPTCNDTSMNTPYIHVDV